MRSLLRALTAKQNRAWPPQAALQPEAGRRGLWARYSWLLLVGALLIGAALTLARFAPSESPALLPETSTELAVPATTPALTAAAQSDDFLTYADPLDVQEELPWGDLALDLVLKLGLVVALVLGTLWLIRFVRRRTSRGSAPSPTVGFAEVLDSTELAPGQRVYLLDVGDRILVLGSTAQQVTTLSEIADGDEIEALRRRTGLRRQKSFPDWLARAVEKATPARANGRSSDPQASIAQVAERRQSLHRSATRLRELAASYKGHKRARM